MTTIAFRDGVIAADRRLSLGGMHGLTGSKISYINDIHIELVIGISGASNYSQPFLEWARMGMRRADKPVLEPESENNDGMAALVYDVRGKALQYYCTAKSGHLIIEDVEVSYWAIGSGGKIAIGAMAFGASAREAVVCAIAHDNSSGNGVEWLEGSDYKLERCP